MTSIDLKIGRSTQVAPCPLLMAFCCGAGTPPVLRRSSAFLFQENTPSPVASQTPSKRLRDELPGHGSFLLWLQLKKEESFAGAPVSAVKFESQAMDHEDVVAAPPAVKVELPRCAKTESESSSEDGMQSYDSETPIF